MGYKKSQVSVASIVEAAMRVIARQGYAHTSLMDIASEVGMSKGAVHYHFPTKEALMAKVLETACDAVAERTRTAWTAQEGNPVEQLRSALRELWRVRAELSNEAKVVADLLAQSLHDQSLREPLAEYYRFASAQVDEHLKQHLDSLGLKPIVDMAKVPRLLHALLDGLLMQKIVDSAAIDEEFVVQTLETLALALFAIDPAALAAALPPAPKA
jgi:AcrR family transcriptional regulator